MHGWRSEDSVKELALFITWVAGIELRSSSLAGGAFDSLSRLVILFFFFFVAPNGSSPRPGIWQEAEEQTVRTLSLESEILRLAPNSSSQLRVTLYDCS